MKAGLSRALLFVAGLTLIAWAMMPSGAVSVGAAPLLNVTETSTAEPPSPTTPPPPTPTEVGSFTPVPTDTPPPTNTPPPADTPPPDEDRPDPSPTPTATPLPTPTAPPPSEPADPAITKSVSPGTASVGDSVEYTIIVTNLGGSTATGVVVEDTLPGFLSLTGATATRGEVTTSGLSVRVNIGDLAPGETVTISVRATVVAPAVPPNNRNLATVTSTSPDSNPSNNQASVPLDTLAPVTLPNTSDAGNRALMVAALLLGLVLVAASLGLHRRAA